MNYVLRFAAFLIVWSLVGCNALIDIEQEHPLPREAVELDDPPEGSVNNSNNVPEDGQTCLDFILERHGDVELSDGQCIGEDGATYEECTQDYQSCLGAPDQVSCEDAVMRLMRYGDSIDPNRTSSDEALSVCVENAAEEFTDAECQDISKRCFDATPVDGTDPTPEPDGQECAELIDQAGQYGATEPADQAEAESVYRECMMYFDELMCRDLLACWGFMV